MRCPIRSAGLAVALGLLMAVPQSSWGQESEEVEAPPAAETPVAVEPPPPMAGVESIEITGERMDSNVVDEAEAVTRFGMADLDKLNISNVDGLAANVPGLHVGQQGQAAIVTLRGIGTENASITGESGVAFHVDGIYYARPTAARVAFYDIRLIDVKRGPQGLLGGKNSTSGLIDVATNDPSQDYELAGDVLLGNYDRVRSRGHVNIPLGEFAAFRTAVFYENRDGYLDNVPVSNSRDPFDADSFGFRSKLRLTPVESLDLVLAYNYFQEGGNGPQADLVPIVPKVSCGSRAVFNGYATSLPKQFGCRTLGSGANEVHSPAVEDVSPREIYADRLSSQDNLYWGTHAHLIWEVPSLPLLGATTLDLRGGYQRTETEFGQDFDASSIIFFNLDSASRSHEYVSDARWSGTAFEEQLEWQTSLFFGHEKADALTITPGFNVNDQGQASESKISTIQEVENKSYGAALNGIYHLTDSIRFNLGGRWIKDRKKSLLSRIVQTTQEACLGGDFRRLPQPDGTFAFPAVPECALTHRGTMWGAKLEWRPADEHLLYAGIDRGFKSGGFGLGGVGSYGPEKIWAYSVGLKSTLFDQRLQLIGETFFYNYQDMQLALIDGTQTRTENAQTRMWGWEIIANLEPIEGLRLDALVSFLDTELVEFFSLDPAALDNQFQRSLLTRRADAERLGLIYADQTNCPDPNNPRNSRFRCGNIGTNGLFDFSGNELSRAPRWKYTVGAEYAIPLGRFGTLTPRWHYLWQDDTYFRVFNRDFDLQESYHKTDLKLLWESPEQRWSAEVFVENVENAAVKDYILIGSRVFNSPPLAWYGAPRFYGARVGFKF